MDAYNKFQAIFTMYDSEAYGSTWKINSNQITYSDGDKQVETIDFDLYCDEQSSSVASGNVPYLTSFTIDGSHSSVTLTKGVSRAVEVRVEGMEILEVSLILGSDVVTKLTGANGIYSTSYKFDNSGEYLIKAKFKDLNSNTLEYTFQDKRIVVNFEGEPIVETPIEKLQMGDSCSVDTNGDCKLNCVTAHDSIS